MKMRILFLQNTDDAMGGISRVNISLMKAFIDRGEEIVLISLRHSGNGDFVNYPEAVKRYLINDNRVWNCPRYSTAFNEFRRFHLVKGLQRIADRLVYDWYLGKDYDACRKMIVKIDPDIIINSHYELLDAIPEDYLKYTVNHFHTSFDQVLKNKSYLQIFRKYADKIGKFVWLTEASAEEAIKNGLENSTFIYNPLSFSSSKTADLNQKAVVFIGRFSPDKRLDRAVRIFDETVRENKIEDWRFDIYGSGYIDPETEKHICQNKYIHLCGRTDQVAEVLLKHSICILTSDFEGMALAIIEANECGVPVICFNFGESVYEEVLDCRTGYVIEQDNEEMFKKQLLNLMNNEELRKKMGSEAKRFALKFQIDNIVTLWYNLKRGLGK